MHLSYLRSLNNLKRLILIAPMAFFVSGCLVSEPPVQYAITVPGPNQLRGDLTLTKAYGLGLSGNFPIVVDGTDYGSIFMTRESAQSFFSFGFQLNMGVFLSPTWVGFQETTSLPNGEAMPSWISGPVVDVKIPAADIPELKWNFYFGTRGQYYIAAAASISALSGNFPSVNLSYNFYDAQGRMALGIQFFGPSSITGTQRPGGVLVGTNITPFLPAEVLPVLPQPVPGVGGISSSILALSGDEAMKAADAFAAQNFKGPVKVGGKSMKGVVSVTGKDAQRYRSASQIRSLASAFTAATRR